MQLDIISKQNASQFPDTCLRWVRQPTLLYSSSQVDHTNIYHFLADNLMRVFSTLLKTGLFGMDAFLSRCSRDAMVRLELALHPRAQLRRKLY